MRASHGRAHAVTSKFTVIIALRLSPLCFAERVLPSVNRTTCDKTRRIKVEEIMDHTFLEVYILRSGLALPDVGDHDLSWTHYVLLKKQVTMTSKVAIL